LLAVCLGGSAYLPQLKKEITRVYGKKSGITGFGVVLRSYTHKTKRRQYFHRAKIEYIVPLGGIIEPASKKRFEWRGYYALFTGFNDFRKTLGDFAYGFNAGRTRYAHEKVDPDFPPRLRSSRFGTFFDDEFPLTPVTAWLYKQYYASTCNSIRAAALYNIALTAVSSLLSDLEFSCCDKEKCFFVKRKPGFTRRKSKSSQIILVSDFPGKQINLISFLIDFIRQLIDSRQWSNDFNLCQGVLFIDHFEKLFSAGQTDQAMKTLQDLFPNIQFIIGCTTKTGIDRIQRFESRLLPVLSPINRVKQFVTAKSTSDRKTWDYRNNFLKSRFRKAAGANEDDVVLIDVDSYVPNISLMKLSRHYKNEGRNVILARESRIHRKSKLVFASCVFNRSTTGKKIKKLRELHGDNIQIGGTGVDISLKLPDEIEYLMPDYSLYPTVDFAMGFLTRGCPNNCGFCVVPAKEGKLRQVAEIKDIVPPEFDKFVIMDNNLLAHPGAYKLLEEMISKKLQVNFNQTLDIRLINKRNARLLQKIDSKNYSFTKRMYYFSFNTVDTIPIIRKNLRLLDSVKPREIRFICMYGYNTTLADDIERFSFLQKMGASPFVQQYQPVLGAHSVEIENYFDTTVDRLVEIHFAQNGRIFEKFLKWVSRKYAEQFGRLNMPLVDLIFKYNNRHGKHRYVETLAGTRRIYRPSHK
jgi:hypothetical protein